MTKRGYLYTSGGNSRMRFVEAGYDADDESVPGNKVIFDSNNIGTLSVIDTGQYTLSGGSVENLQIKSWSLPYVPLCMFRFRTTPVNQSFNDTWECWNANTDRIIVSQNGIRVTAHWSSQRTVTIWWAAFRMAVL